MVVSTLVWPMRSWTVRMLQTMGCGGLRDGGLGECDFELALHGRLMQVMAGDPAGAGVGAWWPRRRCIASAPPLARWGRSRPTGGRESHEAEYAHGLDTG